MKGFLRGLAALLALAAVLSRACRQDKTALSTERDKASYMIGMDVGEFDRARRPGHRHGRVRTRGAQRVRRRQAADRRSHRARRRTKR